MRFWFWAVRRLYIERTEKAAELYRNGISAKILLTDDGEKAGWSSAEQKNPKFVELARSNLIECGVTPEAIEILPATVEGTIDEARVFAGQSAHRKFAVRCARHFRLSHASGVADFYQSGGGKRFDHRHRIAADRNANAAAFLLVALGFGLETGGGRICEKRVLLGLLLKSGFGASARTSDYFYFFGVGV